MKITELKKQIKELASKVLEGEKRVRSVLVSVTYDNKQDIDLYEVMLRRK